MLHSAKVTAGWKPWLAYTRDGGHPSHYSHDCFRIPPRVASEKANHVWGQNLNGVHMVASEWLRPGWKVADPFVGAGSLLLAAKRLGCEVVGCDVDAAHVETAMDALRDDLVDLATLVAARKLGRRCAGMEISAKYARLAERRLAHTEDLLT